MKIKTYTSEDLKIIPPKTIVFLYSDTTPSGYVFSMIGYIKFSAAKVVSTDHLTVCDAVNDLGRDGVGKEVLQTLLEGSYEK